ncbi:MAG: hypothetical protein ISQ08_02305 [Planctomycetes bacterium]|nr:hypothetical protein [Planctomycetota bacterium]MDA0947478.1 cytochrome b562 [Planctomycetota bacterium]
MKTLLLAALAGLCAAAAVAPSVGLPLGGGLPETARTLADDDETELDKRMLAIKAQVRTLRRSLRDAESNDASLEALHALQVAALEAKLMEPRRAAGVPEPERPAFIRAYRQEMVRFTLVALETEAALLAGDQEKAGELFSALRDLEDPAHERFTEDG